MSRAGWHDLHWEAWVARVTVLALDLEGTLISNAVSQIPRPGLAPFLDSCKGMFDRLVVFTTVREERFRAIARVLAEEAAAPGWFADLEWVTWSGATKNLAFVPGARVDEVLLVDDYKGYIVPEQKGQWVSAQPFEHPYPDDDEGLKMVLVELQRRVT